MLMESGDFEILFYDGSKYQNTFKKVSLHMLHVFILQSSFIKEAYTDSNRTEYNLKDVEIKNPDYQVQIRH